MRSTVFVGEAIGLLVLSLTGCAPMSPVSWHPTGKSVVFVEVPTNADEARICTLDLSSRKIEKMALRGGAPTYTPSGRYMSFLKIGEQWEDADQIALYDLKTKNVDVLTSRNIPSTPDLQYLSLQCWPVPPSWYQEVRSRNSQKPNLLDELVAFSSAESGSFDVYVMNRRTLKRVLVARTEAQEILPQWGPNGKLAYIVPRLDKTSRGAKALCGYDLHVIGDIKTAETTDAVLLREVPVSMVELEGKSALPVWPFFRLSWAPSEKLIAYCKSDASADNIWTVALRGGQQTRLTTKGVNFLPAWSSKSTKIAYLRSEGKYYEDRVTLWVVDAKSRESKLIVDLPVYPTVPPSWSPDSSRIAFRPLLQPEKPIAEQASYSAIGVCNVETGNVAWYTADKETKKLLDAYLTMYGSKK